MAGWVAGEGWRQEKPVTSFRRMELTSAIKVNAKIRERSEDQMCCVPCARRQQAEQQQAGAPSCSGEWEAVRGLRGAGGGELTWDRERSQLTNSATSHGSLQPLPTASKREQTTDSYSYSNSKLQGSDT